MDGGGGMDEWMDELIEGMYMYSKKNSCNKIKKLKRGIFRFITTFSEIKNFKQCEKSKRLFYIKQLENILKINMGEN